MNEKDYIELVCRKVNNLNAQKILLEQVGRYFDALKSNYTPIHSYQVGDFVQLNKGTLLHGTYKNMEGLRDIVHSGLISSWFTDGRISKYPSSIGVWNLQRDYSLKDYINFYSGGTICYFNQHDLKQETEVIAYNNISSVLDRILEEDLPWNTKDLPSLVQNQVQIGIIFSGGNKYINALLNGDILNPNMVNDIDVREFVNENYYDRFIIDRKNKDDFFTDRESAILFGIPSNLIEGVLVGRNYEKDLNVLNEIKELLPNCYICNLDGKVIVV